MTSTDATNRTTAPPPPAAAAAAAAATEGRRDVFEPSPEIGSPPHPEELAKARSAVQLRAISAVLVLVGLVFYIGGRVVEGTPAYEATLTSGGVQSRLTELRQKDSSTIPSTVADIGLALLSIGAIGVIFEVFNRRAADDVLLTVIARTTEDLGNRVAKEASLAVLGDPAFVNGRLSSEDRGTLLQQFVQANINSSDRSAETLAQRAAAQFSGEARLEDYEVCYTLYPAETPSAFEKARFEQQFRSNQAPSDTFRFRFLVLAESDEDRADLEEDVFTWRYWRDPDRETVEDALKLFNVSSISVNGVQLVRLRPEDVDADRQLPEDPRERHIYFKYEGAPADSYEHRTVIEMPSARVGRYVYFEPKKLTRGMHVSCVYSGVGKRVIAIENLGAPNVRYDTYEGLQVVRTTSWVGPTASVAFVVVEDGGQGSPLTGGERSNVN